MKLTTTQLQELIAERVSEPVQIIEADPVFVTTVSLAPLGRLGHLIIFKDLNGALKALPISFAFDMENAA